MSTVQNLAGDSANVSKGTDTSSYAVLTTTGNVNAPSTLTLATTTNSGATVDFGSAQNNITWSVAANGTITAGAVTFQVSVDGLNWVTVPVAGTTLPSAGIVTLSGTAAANPLTITTGMVALFTTNVPMAVRYARANVSTNITGGGSVSVNISAT